MNRIHFCPIRHHSPAAARAVEGQLLALRPRLLLIEGPGDAGDLIPLLLQPDTRPPVAILAYRPAAADQEPRTMVDPYCDYSPELVAMRTGARLGAQIRFFDVPAAAWLDREPGRPADEGAPDDAGREMLPDAAPAALFQALAERCGFTTHDELWDSRFEMAPPESVGELIGAYGDMVRDWLGARDERHDLDRARESWMLVELSRALAEGFRPEEIAAVCGAAHVAGLRAGIVDPEQVARLRQLPPARFALIPYSYTRLSEQSGYGAGNRAPAFYQELWRRRGDWSATVLHFQLRLMNDLRGRGYALSLADAIEARRLAATLAGMRDKPAVGLEELRDAAEACYGHGSYDPAPYLSALLVGEEVGAISALAAKTALQQEFHDNVKRYGIPFSDSERELRLNRTSLAERASSAFLHRLAVADIPFARLVRTGSANLGLQGGAEDALERLMVFREKWVVRWTPATDIRLIELAAYGNTLVEVCQRLLHRKLEAARTLEAAAGVLRDVIIAEIGPLYGDVLAACERASSEDDDFASLSRACYQLDVLAGYVDAAEQREWLVRLGERVFIRAAMLLPNAAKAGDEEAERVGEGLRQLQQVAVRRRQRGGDVALLVERLANTVDGGDEVHAMLSGLACAILYLEGHTSDEELAGTLGLHLSRGEAPLRAAQFVAGLFSLNRSVLMRNRAIVGSLSDFLAKLDKEPFVAILPILRRSLSGLTPPEMSYLVTTIAGVLGLSPETAQPVALDAQQLEELGALDQEMGDLFG